MVIAERRRGELKSKVRGSAIGGDKETDGESALKLCLEFAF